MGNKNLLFYFSGTGGCLATAKRISDELPEFSLIPIAAVKDGYMVDSDAVGFVFPLYYAGLPHIVAKFVSNIKFTKPCYIFTVVACGFPWSGYAMHQLNGLLHRKKQMLTTGFYLKMVDNFLPHYDVPSAEQLEIIYHNYEEKLNNIILHIKKREAILELDKAFFLYTMYPFFIRSLKQYDKHFEIDSRCNGCGTCCRVCPVENISMVDSRPIWQHRCEFCQACISFCPQKSIQWKSVTQTKGRYCFKGTSAVQIANQKQIL